MNIQELLEVLKKTSESLNAFCDEISKKVQDTENFLNNDIRSGVPGRVKVADTVYLEYMRYDGKYRICVRSHGDKGTILKPFVEWDRYMKILAEPQLSALLDDICSNTNKLLGKEEA